jgi:pimeloyl-ACP methyl ester carboxylesterase
MTSEASSATAYVVDAWQRYILTLDVLRERGNEYLEHEKSGSPPVLVFDYEIVVDGRGLPKPANYALVRVKPSKDHPATNPRLRPFVVIDPRAGHGPGIGGFKIDSEIGIALQSGHPCYFVMFFPQPLPGQTIESVCSAEIAFMRKLRELHPDPEAKPFVIGNCQGGWALMMLAALAPDLVGPLLLAGSPISYWAGVGGKNPMRYSGGLLGGTWLASLAGDLGAGKFDGAYLVNNFEGLNPSNTYWTKLYNLYSKVDTERPRFLEFERWWGGHYLLNKEEMEWIAQNLFVGNKLAAGEVESFDGKHRVDLRNIRSPIVVFASWGDNITPPQQALNWILDLYETDEELRLNEQTIVYCLHEKIGHLGIFVSASIAKRETAELAGALELIDTLPPGLYEALITDTTPEMPGLEYVQGRYLIQFQPRSLDDLRALDDGRGDERAFEVVNRISEINQGLYNTFVSPLAKAVSNEAAARAVRDANPARFERWAFSDLNPWMWWVKPMAEWVRANRQPVAADNPFVQAEKKVSGQIEEALDRYRDVRDDFSERLFKALYESPWLAAAVGIEPGTRSRRGARSATWEREELKRLKRKDVESWIESGTLADAWARLVLYVRPRGKAVDERPFNMVRRLIEETKPEHMPSIAVLKAAIKRQAFVLALDEERALAALPKLAPDRELRRRGYEAARKALGARGELAPDQVERLRRVAAVLGLDQPVQELKPDEPRQIQAPDRSGTGTRARSDRGRTPM